MVKNGNFELIPDNVTISVHRLNYLGKIFIGKRKDIVSSENYP